MNENLPSLVHEHDEILLQHGLMEPGAASELGAHSPLSRERLLRLLTQAWSAKVRSVHLKASRRPMFRLDRELLPVGTERLTAEDTRVATALLLELGGVRQPMGLSAREDFSLGLSGVGRFRVRLFRQRGTCGAVIHCVESDVPTISELLVPPGCLPDAWDMGLLLVGGDRREALLAAIVDHRNWQDFGHIAVVESATRYLHTDQLASITQQEIGSDIQTLAEGFQTALQADADWIVLGALPDPETAERALRFIEDGRGMVVLSTPAETPARCIDAILGLYPAALKPRMRDRVSALLLRAMVLNRGGFSSTLA